jgi:ribosome-binding factor A
MKFRDEKVISLLERLAADFVRDVAGPASLITVTRVTFSERANSAVVFVSVFPTEKEVTALEFIRRKKSEFREYVQSKAKIRAIPFFEFEIDHGERNRQLIDDLARKSQ